MSSKKIILSLIVAVVVLGGLGWKYMAQSAPVAPPAVARAKIGTISETVLASGMLEAKELVSVGARVSGQVETLAVTLGQEVKAGDLLAQIDSQDQANDVLRAEASLAGIEAQISAKSASLHRAELALARQKGLGTQRLALQDAVESATADVQIYQADLQALAAQKASAEVTVSTAKVALERTKITAPISGTVVAIIVKEGQTVNSSQAAPTMVKIANLSSMLVKAEISEADVMNVAVGQKVRFTTLGAPGRPFKAVVRGIEPAPTAIETSDTISADSAVYYNGLLEVDNAEGKLRIGMSAEVSIELGRAENVVTVPASAVKRDREGQYVEVWDASVQKNNRVPVEVGLSDKVTTEIKSGLNEGDSVVIGTTASARSNQGPGGGGMRPPRMF